MAKTLAVLRASLKRKSGNQLTVNADLDTYLTLGWEDVQADWMKFDPGLFRDPTKQTSTTDSAGVAEIDADVTRLERVENSSKRKFDLIDNVDNINDVTGYYFSGYDTTNNKREVKFVKDGTAQASTTYSYYQIKRYAFGTTATDEARLPDEYADIIALKASQLWHEDQGPPMQETSERWEAKYNRKLGEARNWYKNPTKDVGRIPTMDPDSGEGFAVAHIVS